jgi:hypothetical protein
MVADRSEINEPTFGILRFDNGSGVVIHQDLVPADVLVTSPRTANDPSSAAQVEDV